MEDFAEYLKKTSSSLQELSNDIKRMANEKSKEAKSGVSKNFKDISLQSLQPTIKMYKSKEETVDAKNNPEIDFIKNQLDKIFG